MGRWILVCAAAVLAFGAAAAPVRAQGTFPLKYVEAEPKAPFGLTLRPVALSHDKPAGLKAVPKGLPEVSTYGVTTIGGRSVIFILDTVNMGDPPKAKLYVDVAGTGDLSDAKPLLAPAPKATFVSFHKPPGSPPSEALDETPLEFGTVDVPAAATGGQKTVKVRIRAMPGLAMASFGEWLTYESLSLGPAGPIAGEVKLGGEVYSVALFDAALDGLYETATVGKGDTYLQIGLSRDGKTEPIEGYTDRERALRPMIQVKGVYYSVTVPPDGSSIRLEKVEPPMGTVNVGSKDVELMLDTAAGPLLMAAGRETRTAPAGLCHVDAFSLSRTDSAGARWTLTGLSGYGLVESFEVRPDKAAALKLGPSLEARVAVERMQDSSAPGVVYVRITYSVQGQAGEHYQAGARKDDKPPAPPEFKILDESGKVLETGPFGFT